MTVWPCCRRGSRCPHPYELGLRRLREDFGLEVVEYPTTRRQGTPAERAADVTAAFADDSIAAVLTTIGGNDQIKILSHLDRDVLAANPKPFFGLSDNTNLTNYLWNLGMVSYQGGTVMTMLGRGGRINPHSEESFRAALFTDGWYALRPADRFTDMSRDWADPANLETEPPMLPGTGWDWHGGTSRVEGRLWGGCLEIIDFNLRAARYLADDDAAYDGCVLYLETTEEMPTAQYVDEMLMCLGERGLLQRFSALLMARPLAWRFGTPDDPGFRAEYTNAQHEVVLGAMAEYSPDVPVVLDVDFGHTDPHLVMPNGGEVRIDPTEQAISVRY